MESSELNDVVLRTHIPFARQCTKLKCMKQFSKMAALFPLNGKQFKELSLGFRLTEKFQTAHISEVAFNDTKGREKFFRLFKIFSTHAAN